MHEIYARIYARSGVVQAGRPFVHAIPGNPDTLLRRAASSTTILSGDSSARAMAKRSAASEWNLLHGRSIGMANARRNRLCQVHPQFGPMSSTAGSMAGKRLIARAVLLSQVRMTALSFPTLPLRCHWNAADSEAECREREYRDRSHRPGKRRAVR